MPQAICAEPPGCSLSSLPTILCTAHWGHRPTAVSLHSPHSLPCAGPGAGLPAPVCEVSVWDWSLQESAEAFAVGCQEIVGEGWRAAGEQAGKVKRGTHVSSSANSSGWLNAPYFVTGPFDESLEGNGQWAGRQRIHPGRGSRGRWEISLFLLGNLPAVSSLRLDQPLLLVLTLKFLLLVKPSQMGFSE